MEPYTDKELAEIRLLTQKGAGITHNEVMVLRDVSTSRLLSVIAARDAEIARILTINAAEHGTLVSVNEQAYELQGRAIRAEEALSRAREWVYWHVHAEHIDLQPLLDQLNKDIDTLRCGVKP